MKIRRARSRERRESNLPIAHRHFLSSLDDSLSLSLSFSLSPTLPQSALSSRLASVFAAVRSWEIRQTLRREPVTKSQTLRIIATNH